MHLEIEINKEIMDYKAQVVSGLTLRQFVSLLCGITIAGVLYFTIGDKIPGMIMIWLYAICLFPCAVMGFASYNGLVGLSMVAMFLNYHAMPKKLTFTSHNLYYDVMQLDRRMCGEEEEAAPGGRKKKNRTETAHGHDNPAMADGAGEVKTEEVIGPGKGIGKKKKKSGKGRKKK